jgi:hypothetical protein
MPMLTIILQLWRHEALKYKPTNTSGKYARDMGHEIVQFLLFCFHLRMKRSNLMAGGLTLSQTWTTFALSYGFAGRKVINEENLLKRHGNLLKMLLHQWDILCCSYVSYNSISGLISAVAIHMHPCKRSSVRRVLVLDLTLFMKMNSCSQRQSLLNTDDKACWLVSGDSFT